MRPLEDTYKVVAKPGEGCYPVSGNYVERYWTPVIGPSSVFMLRRLVERDGEIVRMDELAKACGIGAATSRSGALHRTLDRLRRFGFVRMLGTTIEVKTFAHPIAVRDHVRLPEWLHAEEVTDGVRHAMG